MKIGVLTLPLHNNYGGILQAFALQNFLKEMGHEVYLVDYNPRKSLSTWKLPIAIAKRICLKFLLQKNVVVFKEREVKRKNREIQKFIDNYIQPKTLKIDDAVKLKKLENYKFDAYIVGSDQVWREKYNSKFITNYFFDFVGDNNSRKISYAASFGVDTWDYDKNITNTLKELAKKFKAISVREDSAIELCRTHLAVNAGFNLDPTMLIKKSKYQELLSPAVDSNDKLLLYILDISPEKTSLINNVSKNLGYSSFSIGHSDENETDPSITKWIEGFNTAKFVVTDSFHGCVFSIIFNKPFLVIGNNDRGLARFNSLLKLFGLEDRLFFNDSENVKDLINQSIDWSEVNKILEFERNRSTRFLEMALNS